MVDEPQDKRRGWLKNGNPPGDYLKAPRCGARTKSREGAPCLCPAMPNGRCRVHGGRSTGPRTREGIERIRQARTKHGFYSGPMRQIRAQSRAAMQKLWDMISQVEASRGGRSD